MGLDQFLNEHNLSLADVISSNGRFLRPKNNPSISIWCNENGIHYGDFASSTGEWHFAPYSSLEPSYNSIYRFNSNFKKTESQANKLKTFYNELSIIQGDLALTKKHPYMERKGLSGEFYCNPKKYNELIFFFTNLHQEVVGAQRIFPDGSKYFIKGSILKGSFFQAGEDLKTSTSPIIYICEGIATGLSLKECGVTSPILCALSSLNLKHVAERVLRRYPKAEVIIAADNDWSKTNNVGLTLAKKAAHELQISYTFPIFNDDFKAPDKTDWNDLMLSCGKDEVLSQLLTNKSPKIGTQKMVNFPKKDEVSKMVSIGGDLYNLSYNPCITLHDTCITGPNFSGFYQENSDSLKAFDECFWIFDEKANDFVKFSSVFEVIANCYINESDDEVDETSYEVDEISGESEITSFNETNETNLETNETRRVNVRYLSYVKIYNHQDKGKYSTFLREAGYFATSNKNLYRDLKTRGLKFFSKKRELNVIGSLIDIVNKQSQYLEDNGALMLTIIDKAGWRKNQRGGDFFFLPTNKIKKTDNIDYNFNVLWAPEGQDFVAQKGKLTDEFLNTVSKYPYLVLALLTSLASSILKFAKLSPQGFFVHISGGAGTGKSSAIQLAGSTWGRPDDFTRAWASTIASLEHYCEQRSCLFVGLDELRELEKRKNPHEFISVLSEGKSPGRLDVNRRQEIKRSWQLCFLSCGEHFIEQLRIPPLSDGMHRRFLQFKLPQEGGILYDPKSKHVDTDKNHLALTSITRFCSENYGLMGKMWVKFLNKSAKDLNEDTISKIASYAQSFKRKAGVTNSSILDHNIRCLAALRVTAECAIEAGILSKDIDLDLYFGLYLENLRENVPSSLSQMQDPEEEICEQIISRILASQSYFKCKNYPSSNFINTIYGYFEKTYEGTYFYILPHIWRQLCRTENRSEIIRINKIVAKHGYLVSKNIEDRAASNIKIDGQVIVCYVFKIPSSY